MGESLVVNAGAKRVALLLSGLPRQWRRCLPSQLSLFTQHQVDIFFHFWDVIDQDEKKDLVDLLRPRAYCFEPPIDFSAADRSPEFRRDRINAPSRMLSQFYSLRAVGRLWEPCRADYALAMRSRSDIQFVRPFSQSFLELQHNEMITPLWENGPYLADFYALGGVSAINFYCRLFNHLPELAKISLFNPEVLLTTYCKGTNGLRVYVEQQRSFFVRRPHMDNYTFEQAMSEHPGQNKWLDPEIVAAHKQSHARLAGEQGAAHVENFRRTELAKLALQPQNPLARRST